ncbi:HD domain-containing protein [bacterium]|nr:HD domain-containing protein [bacterium]
MGANCTIDSAYMKTGMKLARPAVSARGDVVAPSGAVLTTPLINAIMDANILSLCVVDDPALNLPPESRLDDDLLSDGSGSSAVIATPDAWIGESRRVMTAVIREKELDLGTVRGLGNYCSDRVKTGPIFSALMMNDPTANYIHQHTFNSSLLSVAVGEAMGLPPAEVAELFAAAFLHDIGMPQVPEHMWVHQKGLTNMFRAEIEKHVEMGYRTIERLHGDTNPLWAAAARDHHERMDGSGYPDKKPAQRLPVPIRIISVCDAYAAMIAPRAYRPPIPPDRAMKEIIARQNQFDRQIIGRLVQRVGIYPVGCQVKLSDGVTGAVVENHPADPLHPVIEAVKSGRTQKIDLAKEKGLAVAEIIVEGKSPSENLP